MNTHTLVYGMPLLLPGVASLWLAWRLAVDADNRRVAVAQGVIWSGIGLIFIAVSVGHFAGFFAPDAIAAQDVFAQLATVFLALVGILIIGLPALSLGSVNITKRKGKPKHKPKSVYPVKRKNEWL